ncbi:TetR/AcrR family transcriptional regulator [Georgenia ruanii]|uniref:TetR/AcrR family transcriptional regulator n=1 Tax=Georgenia ruanii TaxID=348442 RepID=UPI00386015EA
MTLRAVAERAGVSHGLVRHHFGTRDGLISATVAEAASRTMYLEINDEAPLSSRIDRTLGELRVQYSTMLSEPGTEAIDDVYAQYRAEVGQWLDRHGAAADEDTVLLVVAALDGLALQRLSRGDEVDVDGAFAALSRLIRQLGRND